MASFLHPNFDILRYTLDIPPQPNLRRLLHSSTSIGNMGLINAQNKVPQHQRFYQQAYANHTRLWKINPRSRWYMTPYLIVLWGTFGATLYAGGRKVLGYNTWFSSSK